MYTITRRFCRKSNKSSKFQIKWNSNICKSVRVCMCVCASLKRKIISDVISSNKYE